MGHIFFFFEPCENRTHKHINELYSIYIYIYNNIYRNKTGDEPRQQDMQANEGSPLLSEEVPYQITLIGLS